MTYALRERAMARQGNPNHALEVHAIATQCQLDSAAVQYRQALKAVR